MAKERALTLEALRVMDAIDRRGSFAAAADELGRVPSALSYTMQKLEEELDVVLFDRSGHRTKFTNVGRMLLERGRVLLEAADKLTTDAEALARGWETHLTIVTEALVPTPAFFPLIDKLAAKANTQLAIITEVLAGAWERLEQGRADIVIAPDMHFRSSSEINSRKLYTLMNVYVAAPDHPIHQEPEPLSEVTRVKYRGIAVADTARERPVLTVQLLDKQPRLTVSTIEDKRQALLAGLGVATMPYPMVEKDIAEGRLRVVSPESTSEIGLGKISGSFQLHSGVIGGVQVGKAVLGEDGALKTDALGFPQALFEVRHAAHLAAKAHFADGNEFIADGLIEQRRHHAEADGQIAGGISQGNAAYDVDIHIQIAKEIPRPLFQHGDEQIHAVVIVTAAGTARGWEIRFGGQRLDLAQDGAAALHGAGDAVARNAQWAAFQQHLGGVFDLLKPLPCHIEHSQLIGGAVAVLCCPQNAVGQHLVPLKIEHGIYDVLHHLGAGNGTVFIDMAHDEHRDLLLLGHGKQAGGALFYLADRAGRG